MSSPSCCRRLGAGALLLSLLPGCTLVQLRQESGEFASSTVLAGRVECAGQSLQPLVVAAVALDGGTPRVAHHARLHACGGYELVVGAGRHAVLAFADRNGNGRHDAGEPLAELAPVSASGTGVVFGLDLALPATADARVPAVAAGLARLPALPHSTQAGATLALDDPAFGADEAAQGYWAPMSFFRRNGGNIYALEPFDPGRVPVLFVHGAAGSPRDLQPLIERLDRRRYQAWFYAYPSGAAVESMGYLLYWKLLNLQLRHRFTQWALVAHSMGGLVARTALAGLGPEVPAPRLFVSISTPWGGEPGAELGVRHSPAVVPSWHDMRPEGPFMAALFNRPLPATTEHVLLFGHKGGYSLMRPNTDGTVTLASQLRPEAQAGARRVLGFDEDHMSILSSPQLAQVLASVLDAALQPAPGGQGQLQLALRSPPGLAVGTPNLRLKPVDGGPALTLVLSDADRTRAVGPVPPGRYEAGLLASGFASVPQRQVVDVAAGTTVPLSFELVPDGTLAGYIGDARAQPQVAAGVRVLPHETVRVRRIRLQGAGLVRELTPRDGGSYDQALERMIDGRDDATRSQFAFVRLPAGDYELLIEADGHLSHRSRHRVLPGVQGPLTPVLLQPLPRP